MRKRALAKATLAATIALACWRQPSRTSNVHPSGEPVRLVVMNTGWEDQVVYSYYLGHKYRLGIVTGLTTDVLKVPRGSIQVGNTLQLLVHPIGGSEDLLSDMVTLNDGQHPELTISPATSSAFLSVMPDPF
ncbi:MAG TPA: hypothetical protein VIR34_02930 [Gemmatimonadaceae bacterium]|jgi:hypothetical protein